MSIKVEDKCRTCLGTDGTLSSLFNSKLTQYDLDQNTVIDLLTSFTKIQIIYNDGFPDRICADCLDEIQRIYSFKIKCEKSENILKQLKCIKVDADNFENSPNTSKDVSEDDHRRTSEIKIELEEINELSEEQQSGRTAENGVIVIYEEYTKDGEQSWKMIGEESISLREQSETDSSLENIKEEPELIIATISTEYEKHNFEENKEQNFEENKEQNFEENEGKSCGETFECPNCPCEFVSQEKLKYHVIAQHMEEQLCKICNKEFECSPIQHLTEHLSTKPNATGRIRNPNSKGSFKCEVCWARFPYRHSWKNHMRITHEILESDDENYFQCKKCCKVYERKCHLVRHLRNHKHTNTTPFQCEFCPRIFRRHHNLTLHMLRKHEKNEKRFQCKICSKTYKKSYLKQHEKIHNDERRFKCKLCKQAFRHKKNLIRHKQVEHTKAPKTVYQCESCSKSFDEEADLERHLQSHSNEKPEFKCEICSKQFERNDQLTVHMGMKHAIGQLALKLNSSWSIFKINK